MKFLSLNLQMRETDPVNEAKEAFRVFDAEGFGFVGRTRILKRDRDTRFDLAKSGKT